MGLYHIPYFKGSSLKNKKTCCFFMKCKHMNQSITAHFQNVFINRVCTYAHYIQVILTFKMYHIYMAIRWM